jgi:protein-S-isoprenylcysteine O-methyltransferase Ste14
LRVTLRDQWERTGNWLFRKRSYTPVVLLGLMLIEIASRSPARLRPSPGWELFCVLLAAGGLALRAAIVGYAPRGTSGRRTGDPAADSLNTTGFYSIVRHPLYTSNFIIWMAVALWLRSPYFALLVAGLFWIVYERIMFAEEEYLRRRFGGSFEAWAARTPAFLPRITLWRRPSIHFSARSAIRREISGLLAVATVFPLLAYARDLAVDGRVGFQPGWTALFLSGAGVFAVVVTLKRRTRLLAKGDR